MIADMDAPQIEAIITAHDGGKLANFVAKHIDAGGQTGEGFTILAEIFMGSRFQQGYGRLNACLLYTIWSLSTTPSLAAQLNSRWRRIAHVEESDLVVIANMGDGSTGCGLIWESMNFASMGRFKSLWSNPFNRHPPVLFCFTNNFYAMGGQTRGETMAWDRLSRIGAGVNPFQLRETVDGSNPLAVADAVAQTELLRAGDGPALLDIECYRYSAIRQRIQTPTARAKR